MVTRVSFDGVLQTLVRICEADPVFTRLELLCIVRDLRGRVRLFVHPESEVVDLTSLARTLEAELDGYFVPPIWQSRAAGEEGRLAERMLRSGKPLGPLKYKDPFTGIERSAAPDRWSLIERRQSKHSWLPAHRLRPPWPLSQGKPAIVAFYSFKGGVGRTTALTSLAWQLASQGRRVAVLDLDLEAPGAGSLLESRSVSSARGAIDFIVDYLCTGRPAFDGIAAPAQALGAEAERVDVIPAGSLDLNYLEKLARLDFISRDLSPAQDQGASTFEQALRALLQEAADQLRPDYIFLDSRAGLHDLAGLSLSGLAHVDVLFGRASEQAYAGLDLTVRFMAQRKIEELLSVVVHTMAPSDPRSPEAHAEEAEFRSRSYRTFRDHVYAHLEEVPSEMDTGVPHSPSVLRFDQRLLHFSSIASLREPLFAEGYRRLAERVADLCVPPEEAE